MPIALKDNRLKSGHKIEDHLKGTAELAKKFAAEFGCGEWGFLAGLWHDWGKCSENRDRETLFLFRQRRDKCRRRFRQKS
jgi:HD superfamily phosphohydrolase YqeK